MLNNKVLTLLKQGRYAVGHADQALQAVSAEKGGAEDKQWNKSSNFGGGFEQKSTAPAPAADLPPGWEMRTDEHSGVQNVIQTAELNRNF